MNLFKHFTAKHKLARVIGGASVLVISTGLVLALSSAHSNAGTRKVTASGYNINSYIASHNIKPVTKITKELHKFSMFKYSTANKKPNGIVFHWTASSSSNDTARAEANYEINGHWNDAFVHTFIDSKTILNIHDTNYGSWGAGPKANGRFVQFEFCNVAKGDEKKFAQAISNAAYYTAYLMREYGLKFSLATKSGGGTLWTHHNVSTYLGGTNHTDPDEQFNRYNYSMSQFMSLVKSYSYNVAFPDGRYVSVTQPTWNLWNTIKPSESKGIARTLGDDVYLAKYVYYNKNGSSYLSLYNRDGKWMGYLNSGATKSVDGQGKYLNFGKYVTFTKNNYNLYGNFKWSKNGYTSTKLLHRTYLAKGKYHHFNGSTYYSLFDSTGKWYGYVNSDAMSVAPNQGGVGYGNGSNNFVALTEDYPVWNDLTFSKQNTTADKLRSQPLQAKVTYKSFNGSTYEPLYSVDGKWLGYINQVATKKTNGETVNLSYGKNVVVTKNNYTMWNDFNWRNTRGTTSAMKNHVYFAKWRYNNQNGSYYYSLYDGKGTWLGYLNGNATQPISGQTYRVAVDQTVAVEKKNYSGWKDLTFKTALSNSTKLEAEPLKVKAQYFHINGSVYDEIYDKDDRFLGYMNASALRQTDGVGAYQSYNKYVTVKKSYTFWSNFRWSAQYGNSASFMNRTLLAKGRYQNINGAVYLSLYDNKDVWKGYIDASAVSVANNQGGVALDYNKSVTIRRSNYSFWRNFSFNQKLGNSSSYLNKSVTAKYQYNAFNGSSYYSIYLNDKWLGYVNSSATTAKVSSNPLVVSVPNNFFGVSVSKLSSGQRNFLKTLISYAIPAAGKKGLYPSILVSQAIQESGWGTSDLAKHAHAYFGIIADASWTGKTYSKSTKEYINGKYVTMTRKFRAYNNFQQSVSDYCENFLKKMNHGVPAYKKLLRVNSSTWKIAVQGLTVYATAPDYVKSISSRINDYRLYNLDGVKY